MNQTFFWSLFGIITLAYLGVAFFSSRGEKAQKDLILGGRSLGLWSLSLTLVATHLGAGMLLGTSEESFRFGLYGIGYNAGLALGFLALGLGLAGKLRGLNITTTAELFERAYGSKFLRKFAGLLSIVVLGGILAAQILASRKLIHSLVGEADLLIIGFWLVVIFYTMFGGLKAVVATDIFQVFLICGVFGGIFIYFLSSGFLSLNTPAVILSTQRTLFSEEPISLSRLFTLTFSPFLFCFIEQDIAQRFFAAKNQVTAKRAAIIAAVFLLAFSFLPILFGMEAKVRGFETDPGQSPFLLLIQAFESDWVLALTLCALVAAICSTADSLLCAITANLVTDLNVGKRNPNVVRAVTFVVGISSLFFAFQLTSILGIITKSYEVIICCLFVPTVIAMIKSDNLNKCAGYGAVFSGLATYIFGTFVHTGIPLPLLAIATSLLGYLLGSMIKPSSPKTPAGSLP